MVYRGAVKFDFTPWFQDLTEPSKFPITAKLRLNVSFEDASNDWPSGCPSRIGLRQAAADWSHGNSDLIPGDQLFNVAITDQHANEIDLSLPVRRWLASHDAAMTASCWPTWPANVIRSRT